MRRRSVILLAVMCAAMLACAWGTSAPADDPPPYPTLRVSPRVGGPTMRFAFVFRSYGSEAFDPGYRISLRGPAPDCTALHVVDSLATEGGRIRVVIGPGLPIHPPDPDAHLIRVAPVRVSDGLRIRRWCPGRYAGRVGQGSGEQASFSFCVRGASCRPPAPRCRLRGGVIVAAQGQSSIWAAGGFPFVLFGCYGRGHPLRLGGQPTCCASSQRARVGSLASPYASIAETRQCCGGAGRETVRVFDLRARRLLRTSAPDDDGVHVATTVLAPSGAAAYTIQVRPTRDAGQGPLWQVRSLDAAGEHVLDPGPDVVPGSLALSSDGDLTWRTGSSYRTSTLR